MTNTCVYLFIHTNIYTYMQCVSICVYIVCILIYMHVSACMIRYKYVFDLCFHLCIKSCGFECWGLCAEKYSLKKASKTQQNAYDDFGARTPVSRRTIGTVNHWAMWSDNINEIVDYIQHLTQLYQRILTYTYWYR